MIEHRRLQVDTRKWLLAKLMPHRFGDRVETQVTGSNGGPIQVELSAALAKVYGEVIDVESTSPPPSPQGGEGERLALTEGQP